ncbi:aminotransferase class I/II-fold pyridoxal phosphate-dependent enzyme [Salmonella enterica]|nr:aminotransferase class I/II-fold pyridoxal phosphate-dependent enzyme [Salmonella enterica]EBS3849502.1 DegT/DnrJ/EryC1/StrS aminotransferase family protein [Salmonella enterica subsp. enterica serovar Java]EDX3986938.1 aminotransferase class I/II-fold pyridoxal phosphate-dependent enzyme [Salmonella enterica subsp. enterica serovar 4,[5],12:b:-]EEE5612334.1 aminotransferase class I/II-fold pyridoxal phosphate-dependent enzyme [Salmonella enterica subsp. enterica serovar Typhimurium]EKN58037
MSALPFSRHVPLLNMSLSERENETAASWLSVDESQWQETENIRRLHQQISTIWQTPWVASFMGGRASLFAVIRTLGLKPGDQIVIPAFTCQCVANAISFNGIEVLFADIETDTYGLSARGLKNVLTQRTKAILIQYTFGLVCRDLEELLSIAHQNGLWVIEDCAHATGGTWRGRLLGTLGDIAFFSSERSKIVNTVHGGWVITANPLLGEKLNTVYLHSPAPDVHYTRRLLLTLRHAFAELKGRNPVLNFEPVPQMQPAELSGLFTQQYSWKMSEPVAQLLILQLSKLEFILSRRNQGAAFWLEWTREQGLPQPAVRKDALNAWLRFPLLLTESKSSTINKLEKSLNVEAGVWFTTPIHPQPCNLPHCPEGTKASRYCINLPTWLWDEGKK